MTDLQNEINYFNHILNNINLNNINLNNINVIQNISRGSIGIPIVDGYIFNGWDKDPILVNGILTNEAFAEYTTSEEDIPVCEPVVIGRPIFPIDALNVGVMICTRI